MLKDWKKSQTSSGYYRQKEGEMVEFIKFVRIPSGITFKDRMKYSVHYKKGKKQRNLGLFETKSQALRFAKNYMRRN